VRSALLSTSLTRMRKETPAQFLILVREYLHPARMRTWANGIQALLPMIAEASNNNLPTIFDMVEPIIEEAPSTLQNDLTDLIVTLYRASANETTFLLKHILTNAQNPMTVVTLRHRPTFRRPQRTRDPALPIADHRRPESPVCVDEAPQKEKKKWTTEDHLPHGLESTSQSGKARQFAEKFPGMVTPDFTGSFEERMAQLKPLLGRKKNWTIIGSSFGGLMGTVFTCEHSNQVRKLILLAPACITRPFSLPYLDLEPVSVPAVIVTGLRMTSSLEPVAKSQRVVHKARYHCG
jgi:hypothetical protein